MTKASFRNLSLMGLVLMGASVVTAAVTKDKSPKKMKAVANLQQTDSPARCGNEQTCTLADNGLDNCTVTGDSVGTTSAGNNSSDLNTQGGAGDATQANNLATSQGVC